MLPNKNEGVQGIFIAQNKLTDWPRRTGTPPQEGLVWERIKAPDAGAGRGRAPRSGSLEKSRLPGPEEEVVHHVQVPVVEVNGVRRSGNMVGLRKSLPQEASSTETSGRLVLRETQEVAIKGIFRGTRARRPHPFGLTGPGPAQTWQGRQGFYSPRVTGSERESRCGGHRGLGWMLQRRAKEDAVVDRELLTWAAAAGGGLVWRTLRLHQLVFRLPRTFWKFSLLRAGYTWFI